MSKETINHPSHYGGKDNPLEVIKIIEYYELGFNIGNCVKYLLRAGRKIVSKKSKVKAKIEDLKKAQWYLNREIERLENNNEN